MLSELHHDRDIAALLVVKLLKGCHKFNNMYHDIELEETRNLQIYDKADNAADQSGTSGL